MGGIELIILAVFMSLLSTKSQRPDDVVIENHCGICEQSKDNRTCYKVKNYWCCDCPPGHFVKNNCSYTKEEHAPESTKCEPCPFNSNKKTFQPNYNHESTCIDSRTTCDDILYTILEIGSATEDSKCVCMQGYYSIRENMDACLPHLPCPEGFGVSIVGNATFPGKCERCTRDTFSNVTSSTEKCKEFQKCKEGVTPSFNGSSSRDVVCDNSSVVTTVTYAAVTASTPPKQNVSLESTMATTEKMNPEGYVHWTWLILEGVVVVVLLSFVIILLCRKRIYEAIDSCLLRGFKFWRDIQQRLLGAIDSCLLRGFKFWRDIQQRLLGDQQQRERKDDQVKMSDLMLSQESEERPLLNGEEQVPPSGSKKEESNSRSIDDPVKVERCQIDDSPEVLCKAAPDNPENDDPKQMKEYSEDELKERLRCKEYEVSFFPQPDKHNLLSCIAHIQGTTTDKLQSQLLGNCGGSEQEIINQGYGSQELMQIIANFLNKTLMIIQRDQDIQVHPDGGYSQKQEILTIGQFEDEPGRHYHVCLMSMNRGDQDINASSTTVPSSDVRHEPVQLKPKSYNNSAASRKMLHGEMENKDGISKLPLSQQQIEEIYFDVGYKIGYDPPKDGNCQFEAISHSLNQSGNVSGTGTAKDVRKRVVEHLKQQPPDQLSGFVTDLNHFLDKIGREGEYGNHVTLDAACKVFRIKIRIISTESPDIPIIIGEDPEIVLGHIGEKHGMHYVCLELLKENERVEMGRLTMEESCLPPKNQLHSPNIPNEDCSEQNDAEQRDVA